MKNINHRKNALFLVWILVCFIPQLNVSAAPVLSWDREADWQDGVMEGSSEGNPNIDNQARSNWQYEYISVDTASNSSLTWYTGLAQLQVWTASWYGQSSGGWVQSFNKGPRIQKHSLVYVQTQNRAPLVRWMNPGGLPRWGRITGDLNIKWGNTINGDVELAIVRDNGDGSFTLLWKQNVNYDAGIAQDISNINVPFSLHDDNDTVFFTFKVNGSGGWVTVNDNLSVTTDDYVEGFSWNRGLDWDDGSIEGSNRGNPDDDARGVPTWRYAYVNSVQALGSVNPWYANALNDMQWDIDWFNQNQGAWTVSDNVGPVIKRDKLSLVASQKRSAIIVWENPALEEIVIDIVGTLNFNWNQASTSSADGNIEIAIVKKSKNGQLSPLFIQTHNFDEGNDKKVEVDVRRVTIAIDEQILFSYRSSASERWVTITDNITLSLAKPSYKLYVAPNGNDANSGSSLDESLLTLQGARNKLRELRTTTALLDNLTVEVIFADGVYVIESTVMFDDVVADSGSAEYPVIYRSQNRGGASFQAAKTLHDAAPGHSWTSYSGDIYVAEIGNLNFNSLFVNEHRAVRAREPDIGSFAIIPEMPLPYADTDTVSGFQFNSGDISPTWTNLTEIELVSYHSWIAYRHRIQSVDVANNVVLLQQNKALSKTRSFNFGQTPKFYAENFLEAVDSPGEWYLDSVNGRLYYHTNPGQSINTLEFKVPLVEKIIEVNADHIMFQGFEFLYSDWSVPVGGYQVTTSSGFNSVVARPIVIAGDHVSFLDNKVALTGGWGLSVSGNNVHVARNEFSHSGAGGILVEDVVNTGHRSWIFNNKISSTSEVYADAAALVVKNSLQNHVVSNQISCVPYSGIVSQQPGGVTGIVAQNLIQHNEISNAMQLLTDGGGIRIRGSQLGTAVQANWIQNIIQQVEDNNIEVQNQLQMGMYIDDVGEGIRIRENIVINSGMGFLLNNGYADNVLEHNIFVNSRYRGLHLNNEVTRVTSNVFAWTEDPVNEIWTVFERYDFQSQVTDSNMFDYVGVSNVNATSLTNHGTNALTGVSPLFVDSVGGDFRLQPISPALTSLTIPFEADWLIDSDNLGASPGIIPGCSK